MGRTLMPRQRKGGERRKARETEQGAHHGDSVWKQESWRRDEGAGGVETHESVLGSSVSRRDMPEAAMGREKRGPRWAGPSGACSA